MTANLTDEDRRLIAKARELAWLRADGIRKATGQQDTGMAFAAALGQAQHLLNELAAIITRLTEDTDG